MGSIPAWVVEKNTIWTVFLKDRQTSKGGGEMIINIGSKYTHPKAHRHPWLSVVF